MKHLHVPTEVFCDATYCCICSTIFCYNITVNVMVNNVYSIEVSINPKYQIILQLESGTLPSIDPLG